MPTSRRVRRAPAPRHARRARHARRRPLDAPDATAEPDPGPGPEAVFDRVTGPYLRRATLARPGACELDEDM